MCACGFMYYIYIYLLIHKGESPLLAFLLDFPAINPAGEAGLSGRPEDPLVTLFVCSIHLLISLFLTEG